MEHLGKKMRGVKREKEIDVFYSLSLSSFKKVKGSEGYYYTSHAHVAPRVIISRLWSS